MRSARGAAGVRLAGEDHVHRRAKRRLPASSSFMDGQMRWRGNRCVAQPLPLLTLDLALQIAPLSVSALQVGTKQNREHREKISQNIVASFVF